MGNSLVKSLISYILIASIFITGESIVNIGFNFYWYYPFYILFIAYSVFAFRKLDGRILVVLCVIIIYSFLTFKSGLSLVVKQTSNIFFSALVFYFFLAHEKFNYINLFKKYTNFARIVLVLGLLQVLLFFAGFGNFFLALFPWLKTYDVSFRLQSLTQEPSFFALTLTPVIFYALHNLLYRTNYFFNRRWSFLFVIGYLLTLSSLAYFALIVILLVLYVKNFNMLKLKLVFLALGGIMMLGVFSYKLIPAITLRIDDTIEGLSSDFFDTDVYLDVNPSTYAILSNYYVTSKSFSENPITGNGLGTYELIFDKYIPSKVIQSPRKYFQMNRQDGAAMGFRLLSETGLIGLCFFLLFTVKYRMKSRKAFTEEMDILWALNAGILVLIILSLLRNGNYTSHGKILFFFLYYYTYLKSKSYLKSNQNFESINLKEQL